MYKITLMAVGILTALQVSAQIDKTGYSLVYSSETPEAAATAGLTLSEEEQTHCSGDFTSTDNLLRNWEYCPRQTSTWNKRLAETNEDRQKVCVCDNGNLRLLAFCKDSTAESCITSGIQMKQGYKYGIFEIKAKFNAYASNFPAIWMMPVDQHAGWPNCGEIDIMEQIGTRGIAYSTVHLGARYDQSVGKSYTWSKSKAVVKTSPHVYSLLWNDSTLTFYYDGIHVFTYDKDKALDLVAHPEYEEAQFPYNKAFFMILDQAVGMNSNWGIENPDPAYTYEMDIEYVRIFQQNNNIDGIQEVDIPKAVNTTRKFIRNGVLIIAIGDKEFTVAGKRIK